MTKPLAALLSLALTGVAFLAPARPVAPDPRPSDERTVVLAKANSDAEVCALTAALAAADFRGVLLLDSPGAAGANRQFLDAFRPDAVADAPAGPKTGRLVVCPDSPPSLLLRATHLAGAIKARLHVVRAGRADAPDLAGISAIYAVGDSAPACREWGVPNVQILSGETAIANAATAALARDGPVRTLVVANPHDRERGRAPLSALAPWVALKHRAALLLTNRAGDDVNAVVEAAIRTPALRDADHLILVGDLGAIPTEKRPNPLAGKDAVIETEPLSPTGDEPYSFATGRLIADDPAVVLLTLARQRLLAAPGRPRKALVVSNPGGGLPLLETFSRNSAKELANCGYETATMFRYEVGKDELRRLLPEQDLFLWEGHHNTLIKDYEFDRWDEPLRPALVVLQSCLALTEEKAQPLLKRGAVAVVGTPARTYSASGGAFALAFLDGLLYERQSLGGSLRQAKNFLLAYGRLKDKRLGGNARLTGASVRAAWAFTLWGDPTLTLPPAADAPKLDPVRCTARGSSLVVTLPPTQYPLVAVGDFEAKMRPNARLAGLIRPNDDGRRLVPFVFAEVAFPDAPVGRRPKLTCGRLAERDWEFTYDARRKCGYLLLTPRARDEREVRFKVAWAEERTAGVAGE